MIEDSLLHDVKTLAMTNGRAVATPEHDKARDYLMSRLQELGSFPYHGKSFEVCYEQQGQRFSNLLAVVEGSDPNANPILLGAHYDTCGKQPGADDNAAAVAITLAAAARFPAKTLRRPLLLALFDAEEPPYFHTKAMGSTRFYREQRQDDIHAALIMDLVGHDVPVPGLESLVFITGAESDPGLEEVVGKAAQSAQGVNAVAVLNSYVGDMSDHHVFRLEKRPYLFLSCGRWQHYHQTSDTPEKLNYDKMNAIVNMVHHLVTQLDRTELSGPFEGGDTTPLELSTMSAAVGPFLQQLGLNLATRKDIDQVANTFLSQFRL